MLSAVDTTNKPATPPDPSDPLSAATQGNKGLGADSFMKLLIAQIQHQDPLKPMDDTAFVSQLAQFSALEQQLTTNKMLNALALGQRGIANTADVGLVGKTVTVKGSAVTLAGNGFGTPVHFSLGGAAQKLTVTIKDASGNAVRTMQVGAHAAGAVNVSWDGNNDGGTQQPAGTYNVSVAATDAGGSPVSVSQTTQGIVQSLTFDQGYAALLLNNGVIAPASDLISVDSTGK